MFPGKVLQCQRSVLQFSEDPFDLSKAAGATTRVTRGKSTRYIGEFIKLLLRTGGHRDAIDVSTLHTEHVCT